MNTVGADHGPQPTLLSDNGVHFRHIGRMVGSLHFGHLALDFNLSDFYSQVADHCHHPAQDLNLSIGKVRSANLSQSFHLLVYD